MRARPWRRISEGDGQGIILAVDFDSTARQEAGFAKFARLLDPGQEIWLTAQPEAAERELLSADDYLRWWRERPAGDRGPVRAVVGYCVGCVFAGALAAEIAREQRTGPGLLLIDPEPVDMHSPYRDFTKAIGAMFALSGPEGAGYVSAALTACDDAGDDFGAAGAAVIKLYEAAAGTAFSRLGLDEEIYEDLAGLYRSYMSYLHAAYQLDPSRTWAGALALTSARSSPGAALARLENQFPASTEEMLNDPGVAEAAHLFFKEHAA